MSKTSAVVYVVDDDESMRRALGALVRLAGLRVQTFPSAQEFLAFPRPDVPSCLVLDVQLPGLSGLDLQEELAKADVQIPIIFLTGHGDIPMSVRAMKAGALEFLTKPFDDQDLLQAIQQGLGRDSRARHRRENDVQNGFDEIVGTSAALKTVLNLVKVVAPTDSTVLLLGETGTGKELLARAILNLSSRAKRPFVKLNCAAIPSGLLESELFGHEKGAFTGALSQKIGRFELANGGTLFLDEIGDIPLELQPKLLRVLQEQEFERLGSTRTLRTDVRLVAATNADLAQMVGDKQFRSDLYYRLNVFPITLPPLRERGDDIVLLANYFVQKFRQRFKKKINSISQRSLDLLREYYWPGNIRELENFVERAVLLSEGETLIFDSPFNQKGLQKDGPAGSATGRSGDGLRTLEEMERDYIIEVLGRTKGMVAGRGGAAEVLGLPPSTLRSRMKKLGVK